MAKSGDRGRRLSYELDLMRGRPAQRPRTLRCTRPVCKKKIDVPARGRLPLYCSDSCRQRAYEQRKWQKPVQALRLRSDLSEIDARVAIEKIWEGLYALGLVDEPEPPLKKPKPVRPRLIVVNDDPDETPSQTPPGGEPEPA